MLTDCCEQSVLSPSFAQKTLSFRLGTTRTRPSASGDSVECVLAKSLSGRSWYSKLLVNEGDRVFVADCHKMMYFIKFGLEMTKTKRRCTRMHYVY